GQAFFGEGGAGGKGVIGDQVVGEPLAFDNDLLALIFDEAANAHKHQHPQEPKVEQNVPNFAHLTAFGPHGPVAQLGTVAGFFQDLLDRKSTRLNSSHVSNSYAVL